jgi:hypothetical protein
VGEITKEDPPFWFGRGMRADLIHIIILQLSLVEDELRISFPSHPSPRGLVS